MRIWAVGHGKDGWKLHVLESSAWWVAVEQLAVPTINTVTGHVLCCHIPEVAFKIPLGTARREDDYLVNSLGSLMFDVGQWINRLGTFGHTSREEWLPIHPDIAFRLDPEFFADVEHIWSD